LAQDEDQLERNDEDIFNRGDDIFNEDLWIEEDKENNKER
jgi:hypothetical protein